MPLFTLFAQSAHGKGDTIFITIIIYEINFESVHIFVPCNIGLASHC
jgi:hypothetical protein